MSASAAARAIPHASPAASSARGRGLSSPLILRAQPTCAGVSLDMQGNLSLIMAPIAACNGLTASTATTSPHSRKVPSRTTSRPCTCSLRCQGNQMSGAFISLLSMRSALGRAAAATARAPTGVGACLQRRLCCSPAAATHPQAALVRGVRAANCKLEQVANVMV